MLTSPASQKTTALGVHMLYNIIELPINLQHTQVKVSIRMRTEIVKVGSALVGGTYIIAQMRR